MKTAVDRAARKVRNVRRGGRRRLPGSCPRVACGRNKLMLYQTVNLSRAETVDALKAAQAPLATPVWEWIKWL